MEADGAVDAQNAPTVPWKTLCVFHELPQGLSNQITHEKPRKAPKWRWETRIDPKKRLCALYRAAPPNARVICFDEFGPIEVRPYHGRAWRRVRHPARLRATYRRRHGTRQYLAAYDVADNRLMMRCYRRKRCREVLLFLKHIRSTYPRPTRLYLVLDNFSPHKRREVTDWAADLAMPVAPHDVSQDRPAAVLMVRIVGVGKREIADAREDRFDPIQP